MGIGAPKVCVKRSDRQYGYFPVVISESRYILTASMTKSSRKPYRSAATAEPSDRVQAARSSRSRAKSCEDASWQRDAFSSGIGAFVAMEVEVRPQRMARVAGVSIL